VLVTFLLATDAVVNELPRRRLIAVRVAFIEAYCHPPRASSVRRHHSSGRQQAHCQVYIRLPPFAITNVRRFLPPRRSHLTSIAGEPPIAIWPRPRADTTRTAAARRRLLIDSSPVVHQHHAACL